MNVTKSTNRQNTLWADGLIGTFALLAPARGFAPLWELSLAALPNRPTHFESISLRRQAKRPDWLHNDVWLWLFRGSDDLQVFPNNSRLVDTAPEDLPARVQPSNVSREIPDFEQPDSGHANQSFASSSSSHDHRAADMVDCPNVPSSPPSKAVRSDKAAASHPYCRSPQRVRRPTSSGRPVKSSLRSSVEQWRPFESGEETRQRVLATPRDRLSTYEQLLYDTLVSPPVFSP
jgi:hypothetical protein